MHILIAQEYLCVAPDQQLYDADSGSWINAASLKNGDVLSGKAIAVELINEPIDVYLLSVAQHHNFCVSKADVCAHNFF